MGSYTYKGSSSSQGSSPSTSVHSLSEASLQSNASSKRRNREEGNSVMKLGRIPKRVKSNDSCVAPVIPNKNLGYGIKSTLTFDLLLNGFESWKKFLGYKPSTKCLLSDTFLVVIMTNPAYLSVTKIFLIPRVDKVEDTVSYSIGNLHKYFHGFEHTYTCNGMA
jgi:hypothetical protein